MVKDFTNLPKKTMSGESERSIIYPIHTTFVKVSTVQMTVKTVRCKHTLAKVSTEVYLLGHVRNLRKIRVYFYYAGCLILSNVVMTKSRHTNTIWHYVTQIRE